MAERLRFGPSAEPIQYGATRVWTKARWADDWSEAEYVYAVEVAWSVQPVMPAAVLEYDYGAVRRSGSARAAGTIAEKLTWEPGRYVKIEVDCELDAAATKAAGENVFLKRTWYGLVEQLVDDQAGAFRNVRPPAGGGGGGRGAGAGGAAGAPRLEWRASGTQRVICVGLEQLLARHSIRRSSFDRGGGITGNGAPIPFNGYGGRGNRGTVDYDGSYVFYYDLEAGAGSVTSWSTREIVRYLLRRQAPRDSIGAPKIRFRVAADCLDYLPNWDLPYLDQEHATTLGLLQRLVTRQRLLAFWFEVVSDGGTDWVEMRVGSIVPNDVPLSIAPTSKVPAAARKLEIAYDRDPATRGTVRDSGLGLFDVVVARGARLLHVGSFGVVDGSLAAGWNASEQYRYDLGAEGTAGYSTATLAEKQKRNAAARSDPRLDPVYSRCKIPPAWDQKVRGGDNGAAVDLFAGPAGPVPVYYPEAKIETGLPLFQGVDYSGGRVASGAAVASEPKNDGERLPVLSFWKRPAADSDGLYRWLRGEDIGRLAALEGVDKAEALRFSVSVTVAHNSHAINVRVSGAPAHAIASGVFTPLPVDETTGSWTWSGGGAIFTLALASGERVEGQYPDIAGPAAKDALRYLFIDAGEQYERVYVAARTVVGTDARGQLVRSDGGWLERPASVVTRLNDLARVAWSWYSIPHEVVAIESSRLLSADEITLADLIERVGDWEITDNAHARVVNASVSEIRIAWPVNRGGDRPEAPTMSVSTFAGELDALAVGPAGFEGGGNPFRARRVIKL